jgi:hypothetical protein
MALLFTPFSGVTNNRIYNDAFRTFTFSMQHLGQGSFTRKVRTIFTLKIIVSIFVKIFLILVLHLRQFFIVRIFVKRHVHGGVYSIQHYVIKFVSDLRQFGGFLYQ